MRTPEEISWMEKIVGEMNSCSSHHAETHRVIFLKGEDVAFNGDVEEFVLTGHPGPAIAYAVPIIAKDGSRQVAASTTGGPDELVRGVLASGQEILG